MSVNKCLTHIADLHSSARVHGSAWWGSCVFLFPHPPSLCSARSEPSVIMSYGACTYAQDVEHMEAQQRPPLHGATTLSDIAQCPLWEKIQPRRQRSLQWFFLASLFLLSLPVLLLLLSPSALVKPYSHADGSAFANNFASDDVNGMCSYIKRGESIQLQTCHTH